MLNRCNNLYSPGSQKKFFWHPISYQLTIHALEQQRRYKIDAVSRLVSKWLHQQICAWTGLVNTTKPRWISCTFRMTGSAWRARSLLPKNYITECVLWSVLSQVVHFCITYPDNSDYSERCSLTLADRSTKCWRMLLPILPDSPVVISIGGKTKIHSPPPSEKP